LTDPISIAAEKAEADEQAGNLLADLERRQDDVLAQLDDLDRRVSDLLRGLGVTLIDDAESIQFVDENDDATDISESQQTGPISSGKPKTVGQADNAPSATADESTVEMTVGFSKLPQGDSKSRSGKRSKAAFNDASGWDQKSRAA